MIRVKAVQANMSACKSIFVAFFCLLSTTLISGCSTTANQASTEASNDSSAAIDKNPEVTEQQTQLYKTALLALDSKDFEKAESILFELKTSNPNLSGPWANLGLIRLMQKKPDEAKVLLAKALELNPQLAEAQNLMGLIATHNKQLDKAERHYKQAIDINKTYSNAHYNLALLYDVYLQDIEKAIKHYRIYSNLTSDSDTETLSWLEHLESTLKQQL